MENQPNRQGQKDLEYSGDLVKNYSRERQRFSETDEILFTEIESVGVRGKDVLDFGCGDGSHAVHIKDMGAKSVVGVDVNENMVKIAQQKATETADVSFVIADGAQLPLDGGSMDMVVSNYVLQYFSNPVDAFREISRVLKVGGYFVGTINIIETENGFEYLHNREIPIRLGGEDGTVVVRFFIKSKDEIHKAIEDAGLTILEEKEMDHPASIIDKSFKERDHVKKLPMLYTLRK